jgi:hypothetical protein
MARLNGLERHLFTADYTDDADIKLACVLDSASAGSPLKVKPDVPFGLLSM